MALYVSASKRFRRTLAIAVTAALVAFAVGWVIGHQQVPSVADRVDDVEQAADGAATALDRLGIEYEQVLSGADDLQTSVLTPIDDLRADLQATMDRAPWMTPAERAVVLDAVAQARQASIDGVPLDDFTAATSAAAEAVRTTFGV